MTEDKKHFFANAQINISCPSNTRMWLVFSCAFLCILQSAINDAGRSLLPAFSALLFSLLTEFLLTMKKSGASKIKDGSAAATAAVLALMLPNHINPVLAGAGAVFAIAVIKHSFGGLGSNWLNPALGGWLFIRFSWPDSFAGVLGESSSYVTEMQISSGLSAIDNSVTNFLNGTVLSWTGVRLPSGYIDLFSNSGASLIADRGLFFLLIGTLIITASRINRGWIPLVFLSVYGFLISLAGDPTGFLWNGDILYGFFSGGTIAAAFILAAEPSSSAKLSFGVFVSVVLGAVLSWFLRYRCLEFYGCFFALAVVNCITPVIRHLEDKLFFSRGHVKEKENYL